MFTSFQLIFSRTLVSSEHKGTRVARKICTLDRLHRRSADRPAARPAELHLFARSKHLANPRTSIHPPLANTNRSATYGQLERGADAATCVMRASSQEDRAPFTNIPPNRTGQRRISPVPADADDNKNMFAEGTGPAIGLVAPNSAPAAAGAR